ncbi:hypothetical protein ACI6Q2_06905 [Chitinophagaceae bacterium LWZ2-11]
MLNDNKNKKQKKATKNIISNKVKDYGNDPVFLKKAEESKKFLEKHGFPNEILLKK